MNMQAILERIAARSAELGISEAALSQKGGSRDLIRNWRRALEKGQTVNARYSSLAQIARALNVSEDWLLHGKTGAALTARSDRGMAESASPFKLRPVETNPDDTMAQIRAIFGHHVTTPGLFRVNSDLPAFQFAIGDIVLADLARLPEPGEIALVSLTDEISARSTTTLWRYVPPYLIGGQLGHSARMMRIDDPGVTVRHPVVGSIRGIPKQ